MALKRKISKASYEELTDVNKALYISDGDSYILDLDDDDTSALKRAKDRLSQEAKDAKKRADDLQAQLDELSGNDAKKRGDIAALEKAWADKLSKEIGERDTKLSTREKYIAKLLVDNVASRLANEISSAPDLLLPHIKARLRANMDGENPITEILDGQGNLTKMSLDDLTKEIRGDSRYAPVIIATKASGSTSASGQTVPIPKDSSGSSEKVDLGKLSAKELGARYMSKTANSQ
jgi:hypothetical protein